MEYNNVSANTLEQLSLHDCFIESVTMTPELLTFTFEFIYATEAHPLNPFKVAKRTGKAALVFRDYEIIRSEIWEFPKVELKQTSKNLTRDDRIHPSTHRPI